MNTKGMKFLAVLAVLAMAFAAFAVVAPAETDDATEAAWNTATSVTGELIVPDTDAILSATYTIKSGGVIDLDGHVLYIANGGKIVIENGGKIVDGDDNGMIVVTAAPGEGTVTVIEVKAGGILGYCGSYDTKAVDLYTGVLDIYGADEPTDEKGVIVAQDVTGPFNVTVGASSQLSIEGTISASAVAEESKNAVPRVSFYGTLAAPGTTPLLLSGDLTIGSGVTAFPRGMDTNGFDMINEGLVVTFNDKKFVVSNGSTFDSSNGKFEGFIQSASGTTNVSFNGYGNNSETTYSDWNGLTGLVFKNSGGIYSVSGTVNSTVAPESQDDMGKFTGVTVLEGGILSLGENVTLNTSTITNNGTINNAGTVDLNGKLTLTNNGVFNNSGTLVLPATVNGVINNTAATSNVTLGAASLTIAGTYTSTTVLDINAVPVTVNAGGKLVSDIEADDAAAVLTIKAVGAVYEGKFTYTGGDPANASATLKVKAGSATDITITPGSLTIAGDIDGTYAGSFIVGTSTAAAGNNSNIMLNGVDFEGGNVAIGGNVYATNDVDIIGASVTIEQNATLTMADGKKINMSTDGTDAVLVIAGSLELADPSDTGTITGTGVLKTESTGVVYPTITSSLPATIVQVSDSSMETQYVYDTALGTHSYPANQVLVVDGSWILAQGAKIYVSGKLIVPTGATLTINAGAELVLLDTAVFEVYGKLIIDEQVGEAGAEDYVAPAKLMITNGDLEVYGEVSDGGLVNLAAAMPITVYAGGSFTVEDSGAVITGEESLFTISSGAALNILGQADGATFMNFGVVVINSDYAAQAVTTIYQMGDGATVYVREYTIDSAYWDEAALIITDDGMHLYAYRDATEHKEAYVTVTEFSTIAISGNLLNSAAPVDNSDYIVQFSDLIVVSSVSSKATSTDATYPYTNGIYNKKQYSKTMDVSGDLDASYMYVGNSAGESTYTATSKVSIASTGSKAAMAVTGSLHINDYSAFELTDGTLKLTGTIVTDSTAGSFTKSAGSTFTVSDDGIAMIYGTAISSESKVNATKIIIPTTVSNRTVKVYTYMAIDNALAYLAGTEDIVGEANVLGTQTMTKSADLNAYDTLIVTGKLNIGKSNGASVVLTIKDGATLKGAGEVYVNGTMFAENKSDVRIGDAKISADVKTVQLDSKGKEVRDGWAKWTNVFTAMKETEDGEVIVTRTTNDLVKYVDIYSNMTVPEGVVLILPAGSAPLVLYDGVTLVIDGSVILIGNANIKAETEFNLEAYDITVSTANACAYSSAIVVNGSLISTYKIAYTNGLYKQTSTDIANNGYGNIKSLVVAAGTSGAPIAGAYYRITGYYVISSLEVALDSIDDIVEGITVNGNVKAGDVAFEATEYVNTLTIPAVDTKYSKYPQTANPDTAPTTVINNVLDVSSLTIVCPSDISEAKFVVSAVPGAATGAVFTGYVIAEGGSIDVKGVSDMTVIVTSAGKISVGKTTTNINVADRGDYFNIAYGQVYAGNTAGVFAPVLGGAGLNKVTVNEGAELIATTMANVITNMVIDGKVTVPATARLTVVNLQVNGTLDVAAATATSAAGSLTIGDGVSNNATIYVGISQEEMETASAAIVSGPAQIAANTDARVFVFSGATVDDEFAGILSDVAYTDFIVGDSLWFTAYYIDNNGGNVNTVVVDMVPVEDAVLDGWSYVNGGARYLFNDDGATTKAKWFTITIGANGDAPLYAVLDYNLYTVFIYADQGVKNVSLNGVLLQSHETGTDNFVTVSPISAGTYKVEFALYSGHEGTAKLQYVDATAGIDATVFGMNVTISGDNAGAVYLQLVGIEESDEPTPEEKSEWTITTILLVILVILIAVMAVIVALRLNRS